MPLDAVCLTALKNELAEQIIKMRIEKVQQPERDIIFLSLKSRTGNSCKLLVSAGIGDARIHLTEHKFENPKEPPMFCMLLRKHLTGAVISELIQPQSERVLILELESSTALGERTKKRLILEMVGRQSNLILVDENGVIIDCLRRFGGDSDAKRLILPGLIYREPPAQEGKQDPLSGAGGRFFRPTLGQGDGSSAPHAGSILEQGDASSGSHTGSVSGQGDFFSTPHTGSVCKWLGAQFIALSPLICREIVYRAYGDVDFRFDDVSDNCDALSREFFGLMSEVKRGGFVPCLVQKDDGQMQDFSYTHIRQYESYCTVSIMDDFSSMLDMFFTKSNQDQRIKQKTASTLKTVKTLRDRLARKMAAQEAELADTSKREVFRQDGDIVMANLHLIERGQSKLIADDFYGEPGSTREIMLDVKKSPQQNAALFYKRYTKAKNARVFLEKQLVVGSTELVYLESVIELLERVESEADLSEIIAELVQSGYIKRQVKAKSKVRQKELAPLLFVSSSGLQIRVGRNNIQNDKLTFKLSQRSDVWLHTQRIHGAHVVISCDGGVVDDVSLGEAASLAAYFSAGRGSGKVPVDYALVRYVKKMPGGRPGMVTYTDYKTIMAVPKLL